MIDKYAVWLIPILSIIHLLINYYQSKEKDKWLKAHLKLGVVVLIGLLPLLYVYKAYSS